MESKYETISEPKQMSLIYIDEIIFGTNVRLNILDEEINSLAKSMQKYGQLQNIRVYKKEDKYIIIFGHRRYLAAKKLGWEQVMVDIVSEPNKIDKLYIQIIENENTKSLSSEEREAYIHKLFECGEKVKTITQNIGLSESYIRECETACIVRNKYKTFFENSGLNYSSKDLYQLRNASEKEIIEAIAIACKNPENKRIILENLGRKTKKKMNVGGKCKNKDTVPLLPGRLRIAFNICIDEEKKIYFIQKGNIIKISEDLEKSFLELIFQFFKENGYSKISDKDKDSTEWNRGEENE